MSWIEKTEEYFGSLRLWDLKRDECFLNFTFNLFDNIYLYGLSDECEKCPFKKIYDIAENQSVVKLNTANQYEFKIFAKNKGKYVFENTTTDLLCHESPALGEFGVYNWHVNEKSCKIKTALEPVNTILPFLTVLIILTGFVALFKGLQKGYQLFSQWQTRNTQNPNDDELEVSVPVKTRLKSLDTFRGISIVLMIFVNSGGGGYEFIEHATWNGLHIADLVFPWFIWIMGVCIPMSVRSQLNRNVKRLDIFQNVLRRSITLFAIGVCLNSINGPLLEELRIFGVLQRFGVAYLFASSLQLIFMNPAPIQPQNKIKRVCFDMILMIPQYICIIVILIVYLSLVMFMPVPGCEKGYVGPGGIHDYLKNKNCIGGVTGYIDQLVLGKSHIYQNPTARHVYDSSAFDPEGIFGCLPTIVHVLLGVQAGMILFIHSDPVSRMKRWLSWGLILGLLGLSLCGFSKNDGWIPINKNLWSLSYVCVTSALAFILLSICYFIIDVKHFLNDYWNPFIYPGMNAIIMYVGHTIMHKMLPWHWRVANMNTHFLWLLENTWNSTLWVLIAIYLYNKNIFYSV